MKRLLMLFALLVIGCSAPQAGEITVIVKWTAPGDDGMVGQVSSYQVRACEVTDSTLFNWDMADVFYDYTNPMAPSGQPDSVVMTGFNSESHYCFAVKAADEVPNWSVQSNIFCVATPDAIPPDPLVITVMVEIR